MTQHATLARMRKNTKNDGRSIVLGSGGTDGTTKRFNRNLAVLAREMVPPELLIEYHLAILQNHNPHIVRDGRTLSGWRVEWPERGELQPTLAEKTASITFLRQAGWGMPAQAHFVEAEIRTHSADAGVDLTPLLGSPGKVYQMLQALRGALASQEEAPEALALQDGQEDGDSEESGEDVSEAEGTVSVVGPESTEEDVSV